MVQVETSQLTAECNAWREALRQYREELTRDKTRLQEIARQTFSKDQLQDLEHLHNQFHIQLINIHDVKHAVKVHAKVIEQQMAMYNGQLKEETLAEHEALFDQYQTLDATLQELRGKFERFQSHA